MLKSFIKLLIIILFLSANNSFAQVSKDASTFKFEAIGIQYNKILSWHFIPRYADFKLLSSDVDSALYLDQYGYDYTDINKSDEYYWSLYVKLVKPKESNKSIKHCVSFGLAMSSLSSDYLYLQKRQDAVMIDSTVLGKNTYTLDSSLASKYYFHYYSEKIALNLGYAYQFEVNDFLELSFGLNSVFLFETSSSLSLLRNQEVEYTNYINKNPFMREYETMYSYEKTYDLVRGFYIRPWIPVTLSCKLLGFDNDQKWLIVTLQGGIGYQLAFLKNVKARGSEYYAYGTGLLFRF